MKHRTGGLKRLLRGALGVAAAFSIMPLCQAVEHSPCAETARDVRHACWNGAYSDYFLALANARTVTDDVEREEAMEDALDDLDLALEECFDQYEERVALCEELEENRYDPQIDSAEFRLTVTNTFFPLAPGTKRTYQKDTDEGLETVVIEVLDDTIEIMGVTCVIVRDTESLDGEVTEDTFDYYAEHVDGSVWYFGEDTAEYENGFPVSVDGRFIAGEDGAKPGIIMLDDPQVDDVYRQEFFLAEAEDAGRVAELGATVTVPFGTFDGCLRVQDFTPIEPFALEDKYYAPGMGLVLEVDEDGGRLELVMESSAGPEWTAYP